MIVFSAEDGKASFSFPLVYAGMDPMDIDVTAPSGNRYGWTVSMDGKNFAQEGGQGTSGSSTYTNRIPFTVKVLNDDYEFVYLEEWEDFSGTKNISLIDPSMLWLHCEGEKVISLCVLMKTSLSIQEFRQKKERVMSWLSRVRNMKA